MKNSNLLLITLSLFLYSCGDLPQKSESNSSKPEVLLDSLKELQRVAYRLRASGSIKTVELNGNAATILYVKDYEEYKELNPQSLVTEDELIDYWESGDGLEKTLVDGSARVIRKLDFIDSVTVIIPYKNVTNNVSFSKSELEDFIGLEINSIRKSWDQKFSDPYVYDDNGRKMFLDKFKKSD
jgi:hypothetical protein